MEDFNSGLPYKRRPLGDIASRYRRPTTNSVPPAKNLEFVSEPRNHLAPKAPQTTLSQRAQNPPQTLVMRHKAYEKKAHITHEHVAAGLQQQQIASAAKLIVHKQTTSKLARFKKSKKMSLVFASLALLLLCGAVWANYSNFVTAKKIEATAQAQPDTANVSDRPSTSANVSESEPTTQAKRAYSVAADMPKYIKINSLNVWARVLRVGVDKNSEIGTPNNVYDTGWYDGSAKPGQPGAALIDGHVLGPTKGGIFANLKNIKTGSEIIIVTGDDRELKYSVVATEAVDAATIDVGRLLRPYGDASQGLTLITCNGKYNSKSETFNKRFIVYAVRAD